MLSKFEFQTSNDSFVVFTILLQSLKYLPSKWGKYMQVQSNASSLLSSNDFFFFLSQSGVENEVVVEGNNFQFDPDNSMPPDGFRFWLILRKQLQIRSISADDVFPLVNEIIFSMFRNYINPISIIYLLSFSPILYIFFIQCTMTKFFLPIIWPRHMPYNLQTLVAHNFRCYR